MRAVPTMPRAVHAVPTMPRDVHAVPAMPHAVCHFVDSADATALGAHAVHAVTPPMAMADAVCAVCCVCRCCMCAMRAVLCCCCCQVGEALSDPVRISVGQLGAANQDVTQKVEVIKGEAGGRGQWLQCSASLLLGRRERFAGMQFLLCQSVSCNCASFVSPPASFLLLCGWRTLASKHPGNRSACAIQYCLA